MRELRVFGTMTRDLLELADWLKAHEVTHVAMEATGVYWRPVGSILEGQFSLLLWRCKKTEIMGLQSRVSALLPATKGECRGPTRRAKGNR